MKILILLFALLVSAPALGQELSDADRARQLLDNTDDQFRGEASKALMTMHVKAERWERQLSIQVWTKGEDKSLMVITAPAKEAGTATLKVDKNIWNYLPKIDRTMKVPSGMMSGSWMGSHFSNDDLVKESRMADDYTYSITGRPTGGEGTWVVECQPKPEAPVVWGKVVVTVDAKTELTQSVTYWDEGGALKRTMEFRDVKEVGGRLMPTTMRLLPTDKPDEFTEIRYEEVDFNVQLADDAFTLQALKR